MSYDRPCCEPALPDRFQQLSIDISLPTELWKVICSYLYPSQLARLSRVSRTLYLLVASMKLWSSYFMRLQDSQCLPIYHRLKNEPDHHMQHIIALSYHVCDNCMTLSSLKGVEHFAAMPLPVLEWPPPDGQDDHLPGQSKIRLCLPCRRQHFALHPEAILPEVRGRYMSRQYLTDMYSVGKETLKCIADRQSHPASESGSPSIGYSEQLVLIWARSRYGGDVGINASREHPHPFVAKSEKKIQAFVDQLKSCVSAKAVSLN